MLQTEAVDMKFYPSDGARVKQEQIITSVNKIHPAEVTVFWISPDSIQ